jgi:hypothetical protein
MNTARRPSPSSVPRCLCAVAILGAAVLVLRGCRPAHVGSVECAVLRWLEADVPFFDPRFEHDDGTVAAAAELPGNKSGPRALVYALTQDGRDVGICRVRYLEGDGVKRDRLFVVSACVVEGAWANPYGDDWRDGLESLFRE